MPGILALDPARKLGWAYCLPGAPLEFGHLTLGRSSPGSIGVALVRFLGEKIDGFLPNLIAYEQPFLSPSFHTSFVLLGISFTIDTVAARCGIECCSVIATEATKALTGRAKFPGKDYEARRKAKKLATVEACWARGWKATEDEADAIAVLLLAEAKRFPEAAMRRRMVLKQPSGPLFA
jgi:Holliday junction resolvasome RuvABC endonuclease subunit